MPQVNDPTPLVYGSFTASNSLPWTLTVTPNSGTTWISGTAGWDSTVTVGPSVWSPAYIPPAPEEPVVPNWKPKSHFVVRHGGAIVATEDSQEDAIAAAKRLAAKEDDEFFVYSPAAIARPASDVTVEKCA